MWMGERQGEVCLAISRESMMETESQLRTGSKCSEKWMEVDIEAESCVNEAEKEACNDTDTPVDVMEVCNDSELGFCTTRQEMEVVLDNIQLDNSADSRTQEVSNITELQPSMGNLVKDNLENIELKPCSENHANEGLSSTELEPFAESKDNLLLVGNSIKDLAKEAPKDEEVEPNQVKNENEMGPCAEHHIVDVLDNHKIEVFSSNNEGKAALNSFSLELCPKNKVKEASNDDIYSEVLNPNLSPRHVTSTLTSSSQAVGVIGTDPGGCGEITSAYSQNSSADGILCEEEQCRNHNLEPVSTSSVVLEIPKHLSTTGITKIIFKFSKRKEEHRSEISVSAAHPLTSNDSHDHGVKFYENVEMNSSIDGSEYNDNQSPQSCFTNRELKMSKKIILDNYPTNVKKLLSTRILEGARVKYISVSGEKEIPGIIKDCGYLCGCSICNFSKVLTAYEFELHAGAKTRHPNNHIYLENGKPIYSIIQEMKTAPLSLLDDVIKNVAGSSVHEEYFQIWKANLLCGNGVTQSDSVYQRKPCGMYPSSTSYPIQPIEDSPYPSSCHYSWFTPFNQQSYIEAPVERKHLIKKPRHYFSSSGRESKKAAEGGTKKRDNDLHKLLFMPNGLPDGTDLAYYSKGKKILGGYKQGCGIFCSCCNTEISPSQFEAHAGWSAKRQPYRHIYTSSGLSLHDIALMLANGRNLITSGSDDMCAVCGDGGELLVCNGCPRAFHAACLGLQCLPANDWNCPHCKEKFGSGRKASGEMRPIIVRLTRVVKAPEYESGGCVVCRSQDFSAAKFDDRTVILCDQCEKEYHVGCLRESGLCDLKELPKDKWFCCEDCNNIFTALQNLALSGPEVIPASVSSAIYKKHTAIGLNDGSKTEIRWSILSGKSRFPEHLLLLSRAAAIFRDCFDPIVAASGRDLIPVMVYGRNISGQEFSGMYCVVLIVESVVVSAALIRIFGREAAELPLVATRRENQGKGYFQALFSCIERLLLSMNVKKLVLPAAEEAEPMWTNKLGFRKTSNEQMLRYIRDLQLTMFKGTSLLEKEIHQPAE
ncbi:hypothetical protein ACJIZ3_022012 [Penstemon smallii]|uniref:PHD-type domain-containing protein n=1 Tax=Penstemon smallii TaxID=265156 RepID=A0ABD3SNA9_9LAMI